MESRLRTPSLVIGNGRCRFSVDVLGRRRQPHGSCTSEEHQGACSEVACGCSRAAKGRRASSTAATEDVDDDDDDEELCAAAMKSTTGPRSRPGGPDKHITTRTPPPERTHFVADVVYADGTVLLLGVHRRGEQIHANFRTLFPVICSLASKPSPRDRPDRLELGHTVV